MMGHGSIIEKLAVEVAVLLKKHQRKGRNWLGTKDMSRRHQSLWTTIFKLVAYHKEML